MMIPSSNEQAKADAIAQGLEVIWATEAAGWNAAMQARNDFLDWGPYKPMLRADGTPYPEDEADSL